MSKKKPTYAELQARLAQAEATLEALRRGEIDILVGEAGPLRIRLKSLVEENERLAREWQTTFDTVQDAIWVLDADQRILRANQAAEEVFGCPLAEMPGRRCFDIAHHTAEPISGCPFCLMRVSRQRESFEMQIGERWLEVTADPLLDENGILIGAVHIASDITERKQAEEKIRESEETYRNLFQNAQVGLFRTRISDGKILESNAQLARMFGYDSREEFIAEYVTSHNYVDPGTRERMLREIQANGTVQNFEARFYRKDGSIFWAQYSAKIYPDKGWIEGVAEDITARKEAEEQLRAAHAELQRLLAETEQSRRTLLSVVEDQRAAEEALHESEERYRTVADYTYDWEYWRAPDGKILYMSPSCERITGYRAEEFVENPDLLEAIVAPEDRQTLELHQVSAKSRDQRDSVHQVDFRILRRDGQLRWIAHTCRIIRRPDGANLGQRASNRDITERKQAEESLAIQARIAALILTVPDDEMFNEVLRVILDAMHSPFGVFGYLDRAGALVVPTMTRQVWDNCQVRDKTIRFPREIWGDSSWPRAIREKKANYSNEVSTQTPEGHVNITRHISLPILFRGEAIGLFQVANKETDYTEADMRTLEVIASHVAPLLSARLQRERAEDEIRRLNVELEQRVVERTAQLKAANQELEAFAYSVSHDLRAPLRAIDGFAQILLEDYAGVLDAEGMRLFNVVRSNTKKMDQLITDILALSRVTRAELKLAAVDMTTLAHSMFHEVALAEVQQKFTLVVQPLPAAHGDPTLLRQVWANLLSNAVKYTLPQEIRNIQVGGYTQADMNVYYVQDSGVGFNPAYSDKLFGVFQRLHSAEEFEGTGVGLAIVQRIVHRHGGQVWAEGQVGRGATFYFSLPKKEVGDAPHE